MFALIRHASRPRVWIGAVAAAAAVAVGASPALANLTLTPISSDPFTNTTSQHATQVEPDTLSNGSTIVSAFQSGRFTDGGSSDIGFATSTDGGSTWTHGFLPGITNVSSPVVPNGPFDRVSDPSVAFDARHNVWLISSLPLSGTNGAGVIVSRSTDGGATWGNPVTVTADSGTDKNWTACDNTTTSPFFGNCYTEWDNNAQGNLIQMSTSSDGGLTWGPKKTTASGQAGIGGQPLVQPNGTVIVPIDNAHETAVGAFRSTNGGSPWTDVTTIALIRTHTVAGNLRSGPLPTAEIDGAGRVFVAWEDSRFRRSGKSNDIVYSTSSDGVTWSAITRVPIDATNSGADHFIPGLAVDKATSGNTAHLVLTYYFYPVANCSASTCQLDVGTISSTNGGASWGTATMVTGPMTLSWLANTTQGVMVGDYISTSFNGSGTAHGVFAVAAAPSGGVFNEAMFTTAAAVSGGSLVGETAAHDVIPPGINDANHHDPHAWH
ncbi:MAG TPA: sialidase family protein [Candidatus Dormibacteraeota bacterium]|nr:sialidase family protein [Candidatus Dormibacteraeota bacterium]